MCSHVVSALSPVDYQAYFGLELENIVPSWNLAPTQELLAIRLATQKLKAVKLGWGFEVKGKLVINARGETVDEKPSFRSAFLYRRCLIPLSGWYEWKLEEAGNQPYLIARVDHKPVVMAGLFNGNSAVILTCAAEGKLAELHSRMPVVLKQKDWGKWLEPASKPEELKSLLKTFPDHVFKVERVSREFNKASYQPKEFKIQASGRAA